MLVWGAVLALAALSAALAWNASGATHNGNLMALYAVNAFLNAAWCYMLFVRHQIGSATLTAALVAIGIAVTILDLFQLSIASALLMLPFLAWAVAGIHVSWTIFRMNVRGGTGEM